MENKINEIKTKIIKGLSDYMTTSMEEFTDLMSHISNDYLAKTKEREIELRDEVEQLQKTKNDLDIYVSRLKEKTNDFLNKEKELNAREAKIKDEEIQLNKTKEKIMVDLKNLDACKANFQKEKDEFEKEKAQFKIKQAMVEEQVKTLRKLNI
ncbi:MAG TPA: hypothetical protein PLK32_07620 [Defluviitoga tunisiensis]|nr:hypothetical protein [Defluviitoga tunisiensis]